MKKISVFQALSLVLLAGLVTTPAQAAPAPSSHTIYSDKDHEIQEKFSLSALDVGEPESGPQGLLSYAYPGGMNKAEFRFCRNPFNAPSCLKAKLAADDALGQAKKRFPASTLHLGRGDAFRHCYWSARMTVEMGARAAKGFGDRHESSTRAGREKSMDLRNNATGRSIGASTRSTPKSLAQCERRAKSGRLVTLK